MKWLILVCLPSAALGQRLAFEEPRLLVGTGATAGLGGLMGGLELGFVAPVGWRQADEISIGGVLGVGTATRARMLTIGPQIQKVIGLGARLVRLERGRLVDFGALADLSVTVAIFRIGLRVGWAGGPLADATAGLCLAIPTAGIRRTRRLMAPYPACARDEHCILNTEICDAGRCTVAAR